MVDHAKATADGISLVATLSALAGWITPVAALASLIWTCIRIYETKTVQEWLKKRKGRARHRKSEVIAASREHAGDKGD